MDVPMKFDDIQKYPVLREGMIYKKSSSKDISISFEGDGKKRKMILKGPEKTMLDLIEKMDFFMHWIENEKNN